MLKYILLLRNADVAELADALVLGTSANGVGVRVPSSAPILKSLLKGFFCFIIILLNAFKLAFPLSL